MDALYLLNQFNETMKYAPMKCEVRANEQMISNNTNPLKGFIFLSQRVHSSTVQITVCIL